jgi:hypothetical protein
MFTIWRFLGLAGQVSNVAPSIRFCNTQTNPFIACDDSRKDSVLELLATEFDYRRKTDRVPANHVPHEATGSSARQLISQDELMEVIIFLRRNGGDSVRGVFFGVFNSKETIQGNH